MNRFSWAWLLVLVTKYLCRHRQKLLLVLVWERNARLVVTETTHLCRYNWALLLFLV